MEKLKEFAKDYFYKYNKEGSRKAEIISEVENEEERSIEIEYEYTALRGQKRKMKKVFRYDGDKIIHEGPIPE